MVCRWEERRGWCAGGRRGGDGVQVGGEAGVVCRREERRGWCAGGRRGGDGVQVGGEAGMVCRWEERRGWCAGGRRGGDGVQVGGEAGMVCRWEERRGWCAGGRRGGDGVQVGGEAGMVCRWEERRGWCALAHTYIEISIADAPSGQYTEQDTGSGMPIHKAPLNIRRKSIQLQYKYWLPSNMTCPCPWNHPPSYTYAISATSSPVVLPWSFFQEVSLSKCPAPCTAPTHQVSLSNCLVPCASVLAKCPFMMLVISQCVILLFLSFSYSCFIFVVPPPPPPPHPSPLLVAASVAEILAEKLPLDTFNFEGFATEDEMVTNLQSRPANELSTCFRTGAG